MAQHVAQNNTDQDAPRARILKTEIAIAAIRNRLEAMSTCQEAETRRLLALVHLIGRMSTPERQDLVSVAEAAWLSGVSKVAVYSWLVHGEVSAIVGDSGLLVSLSAVQARADSAPRSRDRRAEYVLPVAAARAVGVTPQAVRWWATTREVASQSSPLGLLVRLADVQALATRTGDPDDERAP
jgi:hypothetical protein